MRRPYRPKTKDIRCPTCGAPPGKLCRSLESNKPLSDCHTARRLISINEAVKLGYARLRKPKWSNSMDHIKLDLIDGSLGPWIHVYCPYNKEINGRDPVDILGITQQDSFDTPEFEVYDGPLPDSEVYKAEVARFAGTNVDHWEKERA